MPGMTICYTPKVYNSVFIYLLLHYPLLEVHKAGEEDIILEVDMLEEAIHKLLKVLQHHTIADASILGCYKALHKVADISIARALVAMLAMHNANGVRDCDAVHLCHLLLAHRSLKELITIWEEHLLLLLQVVLEILERRLKERD